MHHLLKHINQVLDELRKNTFMKSLKPKVKSIYVDLVSPKVALRLKYTLIYSRQNDFPFLNNWMSTFSNAVLVGFF